MSCFAVASVNKYVYDTYGFVLFGILCREKGIPGLNEGEAVRRKSKTESYFSSTNTLSGCLFSQEWGQGGFAKPEPPATSSLRNGCLCIGSVKSASML